MRTGPIQKCFWALTILALCAIWFLRHPAPRSESELEQLSRPKVVKLSSPEMNESAALRLRLPASALATAPAATSQATAPD